MILTPITAQELPVMLSRFAANLADARDRSVFCRIAGPVDAARATGKNARAHHREAITLLCALGMGIRPGCPAEDFSWDGKAVRGDTEAYVLLHEAAHFQLADPARRHVIDFGLGPGPETGNRAAAIAAARLFGLECEREEAMASLLGVLWEVELRQPGLASFLDQNWLEGADRPSTAEHFARILALLRAGGFLDLGDGLSAVEQR